MHIRRVKAGDLISEGLMNEIIDVANRCNLTVGGYLTMQEGPAGYTITAAIPETIDAKITGPISGGKYPFIEVFPATGGTWTNATLTGEAYEQNANASVPTGKVVKLDWTSAGEYVFEYGSC